MVHTQPLLSPTAPRVSVVIPLKNRRTLVMETLESIQRQTCAEWEAIVVDDGSTDGGPEQVAALATQEPRIRLLHREGCIAGAPACRNQGFNNSAAPLIIFLDSDDLLMPTCLEGRLRIMDTEPALAYATFGSGVFKEKPGDTGVYFNTFNDDDDLDRFLRVDPVWQTGGPIWRREAILRVGPWDEAAKRWQDWEFHIRALALRLPYRKVPIADQLYRLPRLGSISAARPSLEDAAAIARLLPRVWNALDAAGQITPERNRVFVGLYEHLMRPHLYWPGGMVCADELWKAAWRSGIINTPKYLGGRWWLALRRIPVIRWGIENPMWAYFSEAKLIGSQTLQCTPNLTLERVLA